MSLAAFRGHAATLPSCVQPHGIGMSRCYPPRAGLGNLRACYVPIVWNTVGRCTTMANSVYAGNYRPLVYLFTDGLPGVLALHPRHSRTLNGWLIGSSLIRWPGLPCTAPVANDFVADKTGFNPRHRVSSIIFASFLALVS